MKKFLIRVSFLIIVVFIMFTESIYGQDYYVSNSGDDSNPGTSPEAPWESISKVNSFNFQPGDTIHFKCGDTWREQLIPKGGNSSGKIVYTSYGNGEKPCFLGSIDKSSESDWYYEGNNIWSIYPANNRIVSTIIPDISKITVWSKNNNAVKTKILSDTSGIKYMELTCLDSPGEAKDIQMMIDKLNIRNGKSYVFSFTARSSEHFKIPSILLMKKTSPWDNYSARSSDTSPEITQDWKTYKVFYQANRNDPDAEISILLGSEFPKGAVLYISSISFSEVENSDIYYDVGNVILNNGKLCGKKVFTPGELKSQNDFYYDSEKKTLMIYSSENPARLYDSIELALDKHIIDINYKSDIVINNIDIKFGSSCGIFGVETSGIEIRNCRISFIGGSVLYWKDGVPVRYGNGINFMNNASDNLVENCFITEIYDAALTNQANIASSEQKNIIYKNNMVSNCEWSFEFWNSGPGALADGIYFINNTCEDAGYGWGNDQRPDPSGIHVFLPHNTAFSSNIVIKDNIFRNSKCSILYISGVNNTLKNMILKENTCIQPKHMITALTF
ncbi:MAG: hypothetical protein ACOX7R_00850 [Acetivibrionales bacterium]|jgi:hypothetical protein